MEFMGITVVPKLVNGEPAAQVVISGTDTDRELTVGAEGVEVTFGHYPGGFAVVDLRGADAVSG